MTGTFTAAPLRVGILGGGFMAAVHSRAARAAGAHLAGLASSSPERARTAANELGVTTSYASVADLLSDPSIDVVHICTPNATHAELAGQALEAGKHVVCEKPLARDVDEAVELGRLARRPGTIAAVPFVYRYHPMVQELRERIRQGLLGRVITVQGQYLQDWLLSAEDGNWRVDVAAGGRSRAFADIGSHLVDLLEFVTGDTVEELSATTAVVHPLRGSVTVETEDVAAVLVRFGGGGIGTVLVSQTAAGHDNDLQIEIMGTESSATFIQELPDSLSIGTRGQRTIVARGGQSLSMAAQELSVVPAGHPMGYHDAFNAFVRDVYSSIRGTPVDRMPTFADGVRMNMVTAAVLQAAATGAWVRLPAVAAAS